MEKLTEFDFLQRRSILSQVVNKNNKVLISDFIEETGEKVFDNVKAMNLEGVVAKTSLVDICKVQDQETG